MKFKSGQRRRALEYEKDWVEKWKREKTFEKSVEQRPADNAFVFYDGPPFITGSPHHGTLLSSIIKDVIPRYQTMKGKRVERVWGWDCHGLPAENFTEKHLNGTVSRKAGGCSDQLMLKSGGETRDISLEEYVSTARGLMCANSEMWEKYVDRIGRWVDFKGAYRTMDKDFMESVWWAFKQLYDAGKIYEGEKVLMYDTKFATPVSKNEVTMDNDAYQTVTDPSAYVKFHLKPDQEYAGGKYKTRDKVFILAWTTTPWTLPGNTALAVGTEINYTALRINGVKELLIVASARVEEVFKGQEIEIVHDDIKGSDLVGLKYDPIADFPKRTMRNCNDVVLPVDPEKMREGIENYHKVWTADFVEDQGGTGIVHIAPAYGEDDFTLAQTNNIPVQHIIDDNGYYLPEFAEALHKIGVRDTDDNGIEVWQANKFIAKCLEETGAVWKIEYIQHEYPFNPRSKQRIMYRAIPSWFFDIQNSKPLMLEQNENINWFPPHLKHGRFAKNIEQAPDWNLSRDRFWATAMPVWKGDKGTVKVVGSYDELYKLSGKKLDDYHRPWVDDVEFTLADGKPTWNNPEVLKRDPRNKSEDDKSVQDGKIEKFTRIDKVLDCWFESGSMPFAQMHYPFDNKEKFEANYPADFIVEYVGQVRAWFYYVHAVNTALADIGAFGKRGDSMKNAFKNVITTGVVAGNDGRKMSKSFGNYTDPMELMDEFSADSLRFLLASSPLLSGEDFSLQDKDVSDVARKLSMIWNMYDFFTMYAEVDGWEFVNNVKIDYFVHGSTSDNENEIACAWGDGKLSPLGIEQSEKMAEHLKDRKFDAIFCSDLGRAVESAKIFFPGAKIITDKRLREINVGDLEGAPTSEIRDEEHIDVPFPNGESMHDVEKRVREFLKELGEKYAGKNVAVLAHKAPQFAMQVICDGLTWPEAIEKDWRKTKNYQPGWEYNYRIGNYVKLEDLKNPLDIWIISRLHELRAEITEHMDEYNLPDAMSPILPFIDDASNWFVRRSRRRFWKSEDDSDKNDAYKTLHTVLVMLAGLLAPFTPFLAEELYQKLTGGEEAESVHLLDWLTFTDINQKVLDDMARTREIINTGLALRMYKGDDQESIKIRRPLNFAVYTGAKLAENYEEIIREELNVKKVVWADDFEKEMPNRDLSEIESMMTASASIGMVYLDKTTTPELRREGLSREVIRFVQNARKQAGLNVDDRIKLSLETDDEELKKAIGEWRETIANETLTTEFAANDGFKTTVKIDSADLKILITKAT
ncbi:class I tRNA ligase family protein [Candidatus Saccharibacteria bacterium]|nr:class I tRNA ligase family protein [Candidatus Saccharibacteria bacterium]